MTSYSWVKLYHEVLHDPKMGRLTDNLWRRVIEVILLAGETAQDGLLPALDDMAWTLRLSSEELEANLSTLEKYSIVSHTQQGWHVTHFTNRQAPIEAKDRVSAYRNRIKKHDYYEEETTEKQDGNEPVTNRNTEKSKSKSKSKSRSEKIAAAKPTTPPQIEAYRHAAHRYPNKSLYPLICEHVKDDSQSLLLFEQIVTGWIAKGWNPANITGILEFVDRGEVPQGNGQNGNGQKSKAVAALERLKEKHGDD
jgi:hypothetical protein